MTGTYDTIEMSNVHSAAAMTRNLSIATALFGNGIHFNIDDSVLSLPTKLKITDMTNGTTQWFNLATDGSGGRYKQRYSNGAMVTEQIVVS